MITVKEFSLLFSFSTINKEQRGSSIVKNSHIGQQVSSLVTQCRAYSIPFKHKEGLMQYLHILKYREKLFPELSSFLKQLSFCFFCISL